MPNEYNRVFRWVGPKTTILNAAAAAGVGTELDVSQFKHIGVAIIGAGGANLTVKCQGSVDVPANVAFGTAPSVSNIWDYVGMYDLEDGSFIDGDTGVALASNDVRQFTVNADELRTLCFEVTARVAGNVTVIAFPMNNQ